MPFHLIENKILKWSLALAAIFLMFVIITASALFIFLGRYENRFLPGISIGGIDVGGLTRTQASSALNQKINLFNINGIKFSYHNQETVFFPLTASIEGDLAYETIQFDTDKSLTEALSIGRKPIGFKNALQNIVNIFHDRRLPVNYTINREKIQEFLDKNFSHFSTPAKNAELAYEKGSDGKIKFRVKKEEYGQALDFKKALDNLESDLRRLDTGGIAIEASVGLPSIHEQDCVNIDNQAKEALERFPQFLSYQDNKWNIDKDTAIEWLTIKKNRDKIGVGLDLATTSAYLKKHISPKIDVAPVDAKFAVKDGRVQEFQVANDGLALNTDASALAIENSILFGTSSETALIVSAEKSKLSAEKVNDLGIKEIVGTGHSNFSGSPKNRRHNIATGAAAVNGTLIAPGEEFSLMKTLGKIDADTGYLPELVIKENKTVPEYGGGLCQIGTTVFRATVASGLPVTQRRNHSYRVSYYEPAGTDATIYDPWPDFRFINDMPNHILIQSRTKGDDLYFDFWGTEDGRSATNTYPTIYNIVKPGPTKLIETPDLKPGEKKCTEHAHNGADAYFDYSVIYAKSNPPAAVKDKQSKGEEIKEEDYTTSERFRSHYVPWQEVCLIGVEKSNDVASSSKENEVKQ